MAESSNSGIPCKSGTSKDAAVRRMLVKVARAIETRNYYEAHQLYRTVHFRYLRQNRFKEALHILYQGAFLMFCYGQYTSGVDLANLYVEVLKKSNTEPSDDYIYFVTELLKLIKKDTPEKDAFVNATIIWSAKGNNKRGHPDLHKHFAQVFWKEKNYNQAKIHFVHSQDGTGLATMLIELHRTRGYTNEVDLFIAQVVLQCLCLRNLNTAVKAFECYTSQHPSIDKGPPYLLPLLNFIWFLLQAIQCNRLAIFPVLCEQYQISIGRDPTYKQYLARIGEIFFNISVPMQMRRPDLLGNLFRLLNGMHGQEDDEEEESADGEEASGLSRQPASAPSTTRTPAASNSPTMDIEALD